MHKKHIAWVWYSKNIARLLFDKINKLVNTDVDALDFVAINPHYNPLKYQPDGLHTTRRECNLMAARDSDDGNDYKMDWISVPSLSQPPLVIDSTSSPATLSPFPGGQMDATMLSKPLWSAISTVPSVKDLARLGTLTSGSIPTPTSASTLTSASATASAYSSM